MKRRVVLTPQAVRQFRRLAARDQSLIRRAMTEQLENDDATTETRNRFRLRRPSPFAEFELRVEALRVFYRIAGDEVQVVMIGRKRGNALVVNGERFIL